MKVKRIFPLLFSALLGLCLFSAPTFGAGKSYDYLIQGALVFDGKSSREFKADIAIQGDRIAAIGDIPAGLAHHLIQARGLVVAPGFIDAHSHSDFNPFAYPDLPNKLMQGVTTEVVGNCGMSAAPVIGLHTKKIKGIWAREGVAIGDAVSWTTFKEYRQVIEAKGMMTNFAGLIGHGNLRSAVMGFSPRPASLGEVEEMKKLLAEAMQNGASGISFGLIYVPGVFAGADEITELCREAARHVGICSFHMRSESGQLLEAIQEVIRIAERAQATVQISHLKASGKNNWPKMAQALALIEDARVRGIRIMADVYPYTATAAELGVILPDILYQREDRVALFQDLLQRENLLAQLREHYKKRQMDWGRVMIASTALKRDRSAEGKTIKQLVRETNKEPERILLELLADNSFEVTAFNFSQSDDVIRQVVANPYTVIGSDSVADGARHPHPRAFGTFPRIFQKYVREEKLFGIGEAIRKMTSQTAGQFALEGRGILERGAFADLVVFDPYKIKDRATYESPVAFAEGVRWVFVNGSPEVQDGKFTGAKRGRVLAAKV